MDPEFRAPGNLAKGRLNKEDADAQRLLGDHLSLHQKCNTRRSLTAKLAPAALVTFRREIYRAWRRPPLPQSRVKQRVVISVFDSVATGHRRA